MKITLGSVVIAGSSMREGPVGFTIDGQRVIEDQDFFRAEYMEFAYRGNRSFTISFSVTREHGDLPTAESFMMTHEATIPDTALLTIETSTSNQNPRKVWFSSAQLQKLKVNQLGMTTITQYVILVGQPLTVKP
jgi:hypothetical protein